MGKWVNSSRFAGVDIYLLTGFVVSILVFGFFTGMETAFGTASRLTIELRNKQGRQSAKILSDYLEHPARFIGSSLVATNLLLVATGMLITEAMRPFWEHLLSGALDTPLLKLLVETLVTTLILVLLGQLLPRAVFKSRADSLLSAFIIPQSFFLRILYPVLLFFLSISEWILKYLFNVRLSERRQMFNRDQSEQYLRQSQQSQADNPGLNTELFENALSLPNVKVRECMIPRNEIESLEISVTPFDARNKFINTRLSKLLVYEGSIDNIQGYLHHLDMFRHPADIRTAIHPIIAIPETMSATALMDKFTTDRRSIAWVVDEFGGTAGIVTMEDLLEEIFGEIKDEHDTEDLTEKQLGEKEYIFSGRLEIDYLNVKYKFDLPDTGSETLSGFIITHHEAIPRVKERIIIQDFEFDILAVTETRIEMVKMKLLK